MKPKLYTSSFLLISLANLFNVSSFGFFYLFPLFITSHNGTESDIGIVMGASALSSVFCRPWISEMVDRIGRKRSYTIGCIIMTILPLTYLVFHGNIKDFYIPLVLIRLIYGIGLAICFTSVFTYVADIIPEERLNEGIGMFGATGLMGLALGPVMAELIIRIYGFKLFFIASSIVAGLGLSLELLLPESYSPDKGGPNVSFSTVLKTKRILTIAMISLCFGIVLAATGNFVSPFVEEIRLRFISIYYICYSSSAIFIRLFGGKIADRLGEETIIPYGLITAISGLIVIIFLKNELTLCIAGVLSGCGHGFLFPCLNSLMIRNGSISIRGKLTGIFTGSIDTGIFAGSVMLGYIGDWFGFKALFLSSALALLPWLMVFRPNIKRLKNSLKFSVYS